MVTDRIVPLSGETQQSSRLPWASIVWFAVLLIVCYAPILRLLVLHWAADEDMGHGFFVPIVAGYIAWTRRNQLAAIPRQPNYWGLVLVIVAAFQALVATLGAELFTARVAFVMSLAGTVLFLGGTAWLRALSFPFLLLLFMIPIPQIIYARLTLKLQMVASMLAEELISLAGIPVLRDGNLLQLPSQTLNVVEACSGIRSLLSLTFLSLVYSYFMDKRVWMRWALLFATVPIAIFANAIRVAGTGYLSEINTELTRGVFHSVEGYIVFAIAIVALVVVHRLLSFLANKVSRREKHS